MDQQRSGSGQRRSQSVPQQSELVQVRSFQLSPAETVSTRLIENRPITDRRDRRVNRGHVVWYAQGSSDRNRNLDDSGYPGRDGSIDGSRIPRSDVRGRRADKGAPLGDITSAKKGAIFSRKEGADVCFGNILGLSDFFSNVLGLGHFFSNILGLGNLSGMIHSCRVDLGDSFKACLRIVSNN